MNAFRGMCLAALATLIVQLAAASPGTALAVEDTSVRSSAAAIDQSLSKELALSEREVAARCSDETYIRRVFLDLIGQPPTADDVVVFTLDADPDKRMKLVDRLVESDEFGANWGRYWRDVIFYRRTEDRALIAAPQTESWIAERLNAGDSWDTIVSAVITAKGDVLEDGSTGLIMAQAGRPEETVAEISRIFLGIQIQCAQCHDHPTDRWKREQFHELAAFFPRVAVRPTPPNAERRTFFVTATDFVPRFARPNNNNRFTGTLEHFMPDLNDPSSQGTRIKPHFFATDDSVELGASDEDRRGALAEWLTSPESEWFSKAFVNRVWSELVGEGFYEPVDDLGPDRECSAPETLDALAAGFTESGYDIRSVYRTIMATEAYQRDSQSRRTPDGTPFAANCPQRLRSDQLFDALMTALDVPQNLVGGRAGQARGPYGVRFSPRSTFSQLFGYDPSERRDEIGGTIQQTLALMNSPIVNGAINGRGFTGLARLLRTQDNDRAVVMELYLKTLSRQPNDDEIATCLEHVASARDRAEGFEDVLWALVNSAEFLHRR